MCEPWTSQSNSSPAVVPFKKKKKKSNGRGIYSEFATNFMSAFTIRRLALQPGNGGKGPVSKNGRRGQLVLKEKGGMRVCVRLDSKSAGRVVSRMEGINHYWRTPSSPTHPDGPSTPDINHHSPTIDPLSLLCRGKRVLVVLIFPFSPSAFPISPPPSASQPHCCVIMNHNWSEIHRILNKVYEGTLLYSPRSSPPPFLLSIDAWEVSMEGGRKGGKKTL